MGDRIVEILQQQLDWSFMQQVLYQVYFGEVINQIVIMIFYVFCCSLVVRLVWVFWYFGTESCCFNVRVILNVIICLNVISLFLPKHKEIMIIFKITLISKELDSNQPDCIAQLAKVGLLSLTYLAYLVWILTQSNVSNNHYSLNYFACN